MTADQQQRDDVVALVQALQDERDELLELLGHVTAAFDYGPGLDDLSRVLEVDGHVLEEIRRRVGPAQNAPTRAEAAGNGPPLI